MSSLSSNVVCHGNIDLEPEVELISLITETLPRYKLRKDYSVRFSGYQNCDFAREEQVKEDLTQLTNDQIHRTLEYFILCGLRVHKMTETYEDCAALTLLVQEQRSHLDLAANIGLNLVEKNTQLEQRVHALEQQLEESKETMKQMKHQLSLKDDLLRMFHREEDEETETVNSFHKTEPADTDFSLDKVSVLQLESKLCQLEEENMNLRHQQVSITTHTDMLETRESQLVTDCVSHILDSTKTIDRLSLELTKKTNEYLNQHEEISRLLSSKMDLENKSHNLLTENDNLVTQLRDHQTKEFTLTKELADIKDHYDECIILLNEKQDEIRQLKRMARRELMQQVQYYSSASPEPETAQSLAEEIEHSCRKGADEMDRIRTLRIMEHVRSMKSSRLEERDDETSSGFTDDSCISENVTDVDVHLLETEHLSGNFLLETEHLSGNFLLRRSIQNDCKRRRLLRHDDDNHISPPTELECTSEGTITPTSFTDNTHYSSSSSSMAPQHEVMFHRPRHSMGLFPHNESPQFGHSTLLRFPDKLQLIKPLEGSLTLRAWQNLATPSLTKTLFENQPQDVCFRGQQLSTKSSSFDKEMMNHHHKTRVPSDLDDDIDYEEPSPSSRTKESSNHSRMDLLPQSTVPKVHSNNEASIPGGHISNPGTMACLGQQFLHDRRGTHSWLDRFSVGSLMTSILSYTKPIHSTTFLSASHPKSSTSFLSKSSSMTHDSPVSSVSESSLIGRLTNLPPLARRKPPQQIQSGLNLLTSLAPSAFSRTFALRLEDEPYSCSPPPKEVFPQVD